MPLSEVCVIQGYGESRRKTGSLGILYFVVCFNQIGYQFSGNSFVLFKALKYPPTVKYCVIFIGKIITMKMTCVVSIKIFIDNVSSQKAGWAKELHVFIGSLKTSRTDQNRTECIWGK